MVGQGQWKWLIFSYASAKHNKYRYTFERFGFLKILKSQSYEMEHSVNFWKGNILAP